MNRTPPKRNCTLCLMEQATPPKRVPATVVLTDRSGLARYACLSCAEKAKAAGEKTEALESFWERVLIEDAEARLR